MTGLMLVIDIMFRSRSNVYYLQIRCLSKLNGLDDDTMRKGTAIGYMKDVLGEGLMEMVNEIERQKKEGTYVETEDSD